MAVKRWDGTNWITQASSGGVPLGYGYATVATSAGTDTLIYNSENNRFYTGTSNHTVVLPSTSVVAGQTFTITNRSTGKITINASAGALTALITTGQSILLTAISNAPTTAAGWYVVFNGINALPHCKVGRSAALNIANDGVNYTQLVWDAQISNSFGMFSAGNAGYVTVPVAGMYAINANWGYAANSTGTRTTYINGTTAGVMQLNSLDGLGTGITALTLSDTRKLIAGESVSLHTRQNSGGALALYVNSNGYATSLTVTYVGPA